MVHARKLIAIFLLCPFVMAAQSNTSSVDSLNPHKPRFFIYSSWIGYEHFYDDAPLASWLSTQGQGFEKPVGYYKFTILTVDYLPHNRMLVGASFLDQACAVPFQGGPRLGGFNVNLHIGVRVLHNDNLLDLLCAIKYCTIRARFDSPPPFYKREADYYNSYHTYQFEYYSLYDSQMCLEPSIRYAHKLRSGQSLGIILGYHYAFEDEGWTFNGVYHEHSADSDWTNALIPDEQIISDTTPPSMKDPVMTKGFFVQVIYGMDFRRKSEPKWTLYRGK